MSLIPWRTKHPEESTAQSPALGGFRGEMDRLFDSFVRDAFNWGAGGDTWGPPLDVEETEKEVHVRAELPGVKAEDLDISIAHGALIISGEKKESQEKHERGYFYQERRYGNFHREVPLPTAVDEEHVVAEFKDGVLSVCLQKASAALPRKIPVRGGDA